SRGGAGRAAAPGRHPDGHVVCATGGAGAAGQGGARQPARRAAAAAAARRAGAEGQHRRRQPDGAQTAGRAPQQRGLRGLPQPDGSGRPVDGEVRRDRPPPRRRSRRADRRVGRAARRQPLRRCAGPREVAAESSRTVRGDADREAADLRPGPRRRVLRRADRSRDRARLSRARLPHVVAHPGYRRERAISDEDVTMIITKKALPRRTFLRGMGATLALPLLDAMVPSMTALAKTAAEPVRRLGFIYIPMGCDITRWTPRSTDGTLAVLSPTLESLAPFVDQLTVISNMELKNAYPGTHATSNAAFLSAAKAKWTESTDYYLGTTADQIAAQHIGS